MSQYAENNMNRNEDTRNTRNDKNFGNGGSYLIAFIFLVIIILICFYLFKPTFILKDCARQGVNSSGSSAHDHEDDKDGSHYHKEVDFVRACVWAFIIAFIVVVVWWCFVAFTTMSACQPDCRCNKCMYKHHH